MDQPDRWSFQLFLYLFNFRNNWYFVPVLNNNDDDNNNNHTKLGGMLLCSVCGIIVVDYFTASLVPPISTTWMSTGYNVALTSRVHSNVKYSQQSQLRTCATVE